MPYIQNRRRLNIYYEVINAEKQLPPLIFVHGFGSSLSMFARQITALEPYFRLILFDAEGHGKSEKAEEDLQENLVKNILKDLILVLDSLEIRGNIGIIGHSLLGTGVAISYTLIFPQKVDFLILLNGGLLRLDSAIRNIFWNLLPQFTRMNFNELAQTQFDLILEKTIPFIIMALADENTNKSNNSDDIGQKINDELYGLMAVEVDTTQISCPVLIIGAELDNFAPVYMSKELKKKISGAELNIITMAGHFGLNHRYKAYNKHILEFLKNHHLIRDVKTNA
jgi:pimeloyl-ACP methyl ester carboxylesterase